MLERELVPSYSASHNFNKNIVVLPLQRNIIVALVEAVMKETTKLQELGGYPFQLSRNHFVCATTIFIYTYVPAASSSVCVRRSFSLTRRKRMAELENVHNSLTEELQKRYMCPGCGTNNMAVEETN